MLNLNHHISLLKCSDISFSHFFMYACAFSGVTIQEFILFVKKMSSKCCNAPLLLNASNCVFLLCGALLVLSGFYLYRDNKRVLLSRLLAATSDALYDLPQPLFYYLSIGFVVAGVTATLAAIMGFWASCLNTYCCFSFYFLMIVLLLLMESIICLAITLWPHCLGISLNDTKMVRTLQSNYGVPGHEQFTIAMDLAQTQFGCCGMTAMDNYDNSVWKLETYGQKDWMVPLTCCMLENSLATFSYLDPKPVNQTKCQSMQISNHKHYRYMQPCLDYLDNWYRYQYATFLGGCLVLAFIEFCVLFSIVIACTRVSRQQMKMTEFLEMRSRGKSCQMLVENIYEPEVELRSATTNDFRQGSAHPIPGDFTEDFKEIYIQPRDLYKHRFNTTFKPISTDYNINTNNYLT